MIKKPYFQVNSKIHANSDIFGNVLGIPLQWRKYVFLLKNILYLDLKETTYDIKNSVNKGLFYFFGQRHVSLSLTEFIPKKYWVD